MEEDNRQVIQHLRDQSWSEFARSLVEQYDRRGSLSPAQWEAGRRMLRKLRGNSVLKAAQESARYVRRW